jgi:translation initiation factor IF-3
VALDLLAHIADQLQDIAVVEQRPAKEGMTMLMILSPNR